MHYYKSYNMEPVSQARAVAINQPRNYKYNEIPKHSFVETTVAEHC
jgi:hypothetical protein